MERMGGIPERERTGMPRDFENGAGWIEMRPDTGADGETGRER